MNPFNNMNSLWALLILIADIWAIVTIVRSKATLGIKILWIAVVLLLPIIGLLLWFFLGPK